MPDILIRGLSPETIERLKEHAKLHGRSLQSQAKLALEQAARVEGEGVAEILSKWQGRFAGRTLSRSVDLIREDRSR